MTVDLQSEAPTVAPDPRAALKRYTLVDYATQAWLGIVALLVLFYHRGGPGTWLPIVVGHAAGIAGIHWAVYLARTGRANRFGRFVRSFYPIFLFPFFYRETGIVNPLIAGTFYDAPFIALEARLFGLQPSWEFMAALPYRLVAELFYMAYFSYYLIVFGVGFAIYLNDRARFFHYVSLVAVVFFVCFLIFIFFPVLGPTAILIPKYAAKVGIAFPVPPFPPAVASAFFFKVMGFIHPNYQVIGAAFPSSHVAVSLTALYCAWLYFRRMRYVLLVDVMLLMLSTVYCRYHYAVDVLGGIIVALVVVPLAEMLYRKIQRLTAVP